MAWRVGTSFSDGVLAEISGGSPRISFYIYVYTFFLGGGQSIQLAFSVICKFMH